MVDVMDMLLLMEEHRCEAMVDVMDMLEKTVMDVTGRGCCCGGSVSAVSTRALKFTLYKGAVLSKLLYGGELWTLTKTCLSALRGFNASELSCLFYETKETHTANGAPQ